MTSYDRLRSVLAESPFANASVELAPESWNPDAPRLALVRWSWKNEDRDDLVEFLSERGFVARDRVASITVEVAI